MAAYSFWMVDRARVVDDRLFVGNLNAGHQKTFLLMMLMVAIGPHLVSLVSPVASNGFKHTKAHYFVWSFLACHLACIVLLRDYGGDIGLLAVCVTWPVWNLADMALSLHQCHEISGRLHHFLTNQCNVGIVVCPFITKHN